MQKPLFNTAALAAVILLAGCASPPQPERDGQQTLFNTAEDMSARMSPLDGISTVGVGKSKSIDLARNRAIANGRLSLQKTLDAKMRTLQQNFFKESGMAQNAQRLRAFRTATLSVKKQIQKSPPKELNHEIIDGTVNAYALLEFNPEIILQQLGQHEELYARFRTTETYKELAKAIEDYKLPAETQKLTPAEQ